MPLITLTAHTPGISILQKQHRELLASIPEEHQPECRDLKEKIESLERLTIDALRSVEGSPELDRLLPIKDLNNTTRYSLMCLISAEKEAAEIEAGRQERITEKDAEVAARKKWQTDERWLQAGLSVITIISVTVLVETVKIIFK